MAVTAAVSLIRILCANTLGYALRRAEGADAQRTFRFRHTGGLHTYQCGNCRHPGSSLGGASIIDRSVRAAHVLAL